MENLTLRESKEFTIRDMLVEIKNAGMEAVDFEPGHNAMIGKVREFIEELD